MEKLDEKSRKKDVSDSVTTESREKSGSACGNGRLSFHYSSSAQFGLPIGNCLKNDDIKSPVNVETVDKSRIKKQGPNCSDIEMMKERFAKLLLGEDMSGNGKGVCSALTISNAITNLCATVFGQLWRLEPLPCEKKSMWRREMGWLLSVTDHIVELKPSWQTFPDGSQVEVMSCQPRSDLLMNLPALEKLDNMLLEILDGFCDREFWYVDQGIVAAEGDGSVSLKKAVQRQEEKWWLPVPRVPHGGLPECARKELVQKLESANQILKAATAINCIALAEMEVPESYLETLPKNGRGCVGDVVHRYMSSNHFSSECLLDFLDLCSEHAALEMANRVEAAIYVWGTRQTTRHRCSAKSSLAQRAQTLLQALKHRFPGLTQTTLDTAKIQHNKDVGKSILESYSRVLESLAFNIVARIEDLLYVDDINKQSDKLSMKKIPLPRGSPYRTPNFSPTPASTPSPRNVNSPRLKRVLTNYLLADANTNTQRNHAFN